MSKVQNMELMGWRVLTEAEIGFLMTTRNYAGALILKFVAMKKDAAAIDMHNENEAENLQQKMRQTISKAALTRTLQVYAQGRTVILTKVRYGEDLVLKEDQEAVFQ
jgi:hypothetical protein